MTCPLIRGLAFPDSVIPAACDSPWLLLACRYVGDPEGVAAALQRVWPLLSAIIEHLRGSTRATERIARCPRYALRTAGGASLDLGIDRRSYDNFEDIPVP